MPLDWLLKPFRKRFRFHFYGNKQTNCLEKVGSTWLQSVCVWIVSSHCWLISLVRVVFTWVLKVMCISFGFVLLYTTWLTKKHVLLFCPSTIVTHLHMFCGTLCQQHDCQCLLWVLIGLLDSACHLWFGSGLLTLSWKLFLIFELFIYLCYIFFKMLSL